VTATSASTRENAPALDWEAFCAVHFPHRRRHDLEAIVAYGAYRHSRSMDERSAGEAAGIDEAKVPPGTTALQSWEDEGGAAR